MIAVIAGVDDQRVVGLSCLVESIHHRAHLRIQKTTEAIVRGSCDLARLIIKALVVVKRSADSLGDGMLWQRLLGPEAGLVHLFKRIEVIERLGADQRIVRS